MAEAFGYAPREVDHLHVRDLAVMLHGAVRKKKDSWQQSALVASKIHNMGGPRGEKFQPKNPADLYPELFNREGKTDDEWAEEMEETFARYNPQA